MRRSPEVGCGHTPRIALLRGAKERRMQGDHRRDSPAAQRMPKTATMGHERPLDERPRQLVIEECLVRPIKGLVGKEAALPPVQLCYTAVALGLIGLDHVVTCMRSFSPSASGNKACTITSCFRALPITASSALRALATTSGCAVRSEKDLEDECLRHHRDARLGWRARPWP
jgi:hypothetical protein